MTRFNSALHRLRNAARLQRPEPVTDAPLGLSDRRLRMMTRLLLGPGSRPTQDQIDEYRMYMYVGDPLADAVAEWMAASGFKQGMRMFEQALESGIDSVKDAPDCLKALFAVVDRRPLWVDDELIRLGQRAINRSGLPVQFILGYLFLLGGYGVSVAMNKALVMTGGLREGSARKRSIETAAWWLDVTREGGLDRDQPGFRTTMRVRVLHAVVRRRLSGDRDWDLQAHGLPINQAHMAATGHAFGAACLISCRLSGLHFTPREREAFMHLWRYANWLGGVDERLSSATEREAMRIIQMSVLTAPTDNEYAEELARSFVEQIDYRWPKLGTPGRWLSRSITNGCLGLAWLGLGREAYRNLGLSESQAWLPLTVAGLGVVTVREQLRRLVPGSDHLLAPLGRWLQEQQVNQLRSHHEQPDQYIPYEQGKRVEAA